MITLYILVSLIIDVVFFMWILADGTKHNRDYAATMTAKRRV